MYTYHMISVLTRCQPLPPGTLAKMAFSMIPSAMLVYFFIVPGLASLSSGDLLPVDTKVVIRTTIQQLTIGGGSGRAEATMQSMLYGKSCPSVRPETAQTHFHQNHEGFCQLEECYEDRSSLEGWRNAMKIEGHHSPTPPYLSRLLAEICFFCFSYHHYFKSCNRLISVPSCLLPCKQHCNLA